MAAEIRQIGIRRREFERFITTLEKLPEDVTTFEESMWSSLVEYVTVSGKDDLQLGSMCAMRVIRLSDEEISINGTSSEPSEAPSSLALLQFPRRSVFYFPDASFSFAVMSLLLITLLFS